MKKLIPILIICFIASQSCNEDNDDNVSQVHTSFSFSHNWDRSDVTNADFNTLKFTNASGQQLSIERLRYLISEITFTSTSGEKLVLNGYNLVDVTNNENLSFTPVNSIPTGSYSNVSFAFGFNNEDNLNNYIELNTASWNVPAMLGGGYHYMQLDGKFLNASSEEQGYNYHAIRAADNPGENPTFPQDTFFVVDLGATTISNDVTFNIEMNIAEWFKNPNTWDLNALNQMLMPNSSAQIMMFENGQNVFSLNSINQ